MTIAEGFHNESDEALSDRTLFQCAVKLKKRRLSAVLDHLKSIYAIYLYPSLWVLKLDYAEKLKHYHLLWKVLLAVLAVYTSLKEQLHQTFPLIKIVAKK